MGYVGDCPLMITSCYRVAALRKILVNISKSSPCGLTARSQRFVGYFSVSGGVASRTTRFIGCHLTTYILTSPCFLQEWNVGIVGDY